jgi:hypothetical protein
VGLVLPQVLIPALLCWVIASGTLDGGLLAWDGVGLRVSLRGSDNDYDRDLIHDWDCRWDSMWDSQSVNHLATSYY